MGEISDLIGIYGAIDRAVAEDADARRGVAGCSRVYRDPDVRVVRRVRRAGR